MKKILSLLLAVVMVISVMSMTAFAANANGSLTVTADKTSAKRGDVVNYTVYLDDCSAFSGGVYNVEFTLSIPEGLEFQSGSLNANFSSATGILAMDFNANALKVSGMGALAAGYTGGQIAVLNFSCKVADDASGSLTVGLTGPVLTNENGAAVTPATTGASVSIEVPHVCAPEAVAEDPATCTEDGVKAHYACECGKLYADAAGKTEVTAASLVIKATGHSYGEWKETKAPTCEEKGTETRTCACGETETREVAATGHSYGEWKETKAPTCEEKGTETRTCACGESETREVAATGHTWDEGKVTKEATCAAEGEKTYTCEDCGETKTEAVAKLEHAWDEGKVTKEPTCTEAGEKSATCTVCGESDSAVEIPAVGHTWDEGKVTKEATCTAEGEKTYTCSVCGETKIEKIEALGHTVKEGVWKSDAENHWQECETCGEKLETVKHAGGKATTEKKAVCEVCGAEYGELAAAADKDDSKTTDNPETGDNHNVVLWLALLLIAMFGMVAAAVIRRKRA